MSLSSQFDPWSAGDEKQEATDNGQPEAFDADAAATYVRIEGVNPGDFSDSDRERLERTLLEHLLREAGAGLQVTNVRVLEEYHAAPL